jgi:hypothetical protein
VQQLLRNVSVTGDEIKTTLLGTNIAFLGLLGQLRNIMVPFQRRGIGKDTGVYEVCITGTYSV